MQRAQGRRADLGFAGTALCYNESGVPAVQLPFYRLSHRKLGVIEGIPGTSIVSSFAQDQPIPSNSNFANWKDFLSHQACSCHI